MKPRLGMLLLVILAVAVIATRAVPAWASAMTLETEHGNAFGWNLRHEGKLVTLEFNFWNRGPWPVTARTVSLPVRNHLRIEREGVMHGNCPYYGAESNLVGRFVKPVDGYHLGVWDRICVVAFLTPQAPGAFHVGPVTLRAELQLPLGAIPVQVTSGFQSTLCVRQKC